MPSKSSTPTCLIIALASVVLAACQQQSADSSAAASASASAVAAPVIAAPAPMASVSLPGDHAVTRHFRIAITLPTLPAGEKALTAALRTTADNAKRGFMQALPDPRQSPEFANRRFELLLKFRIVANTPAFTSVRETGMQGTGGAHPIPVEATFVYDRKAGKLITLDDLFADSDAARKTLANFARDSLLKKFKAHAPKPGTATSPDAIREWKTNMVQMLDNGTQPTSVNYSVFVVRAGSTQAQPSPGITLIFPPYQVAPYVYGTQTVDVPTGEFSKFLKPQYRGTFTN
ncbi:MAG TPA: RsiV family protein [Rhodanobacteraceae bacterium]|nr:RsiV family protein [Rhodanobacteraceae bacterium]